MNYRKISIRLYISLFVLLPNLLFAQSILKGKVIDASDKKPVPFATVFLNNTSTGTRTLDNGMFTLHNVKNGKYTVIISCIGYTAMKQEVFVKGETIKLAVTELKPTARQLSEVKIKSKKVLTAAQRRNYMRWFLHGFLGKTPNAMNCKLVNPQALDFEYNSKSGKFMATASDELIVDNYALGYRIKYMLNGFSWDQHNHIINYTGFSRYEDLKGSPEQQQEWTKKRVKVYLGSQMHFFRSAIANQLSQNNFYVFELFRSLRPGRPTDSLIAVKINQFVEAGGPDDSLSYWWKQQQTPLHDQAAGKLLPIDDYIRITNQRGIFRFSHQTSLLINYKNPHNNTQWGSTIVSFVGKQAFFDLNGVIMDPLDVMIELYWQNMRLADTLPDDYELPPTSS